MKFKKNEKRAFREACAIVGAGAGLAYAAPALMNLHDTFALVGAVLLIIGWAGWIGNFIFRHS